MSTVVNIASFLDSFNASQATPGSSTSSVPNTTERKLLYFLGKLGKSNMSQLANLAGTTPEESQAALAGMESLQLITSTESVDNDRTYSLTPTGEMVAGDISL